MNDERQSPTASGNKPKRTVVVVEDDQIVATLLESLLGREGFEVQMAQDGRQATSLIEHATEPPALVLLDVMLPYVDGLELLRKIRAQVSWSAVPIIMLTAKSQEQTIVRALDQGANDYIVKPFRPGELLARIRRVTNQQLQ